MIHGHMDDHTVCAVIATAAVLWGAFLLILGRQDTRHHRRQLPRAVQPPRPPVPSSVREESAARPSPSSSSSGRHARHGGTR